MKIYSNQLPSLRGVLDQALIVCAGWKEFRDELIVPNMSFEEFEERIENVKKKIEFAHNAQQKRTDAIEERNKALQEVWEVIKLVRNSARAVFGEDSVEAAEYGGRPVRFQKTYPKKLSTQ